MSNTNSKPIVRFAPSPTGNLHLGGARTALFNWLFARSQGGSVHLRIEDTDAKRSRDEFSVSLQDDLAWLGLDFDGPVIYQSHNRDRHHAVVDELLSKGHAYRTSAPVNRPGSGQPQYGNSTDTPRENDTPVDPDATVVRLRIPPNTRQSSVSIRDCVQGTISMPGDQLDDFVLLRSDGSPTYMLAVVVDDYDLGVTHIIRGSDHLTNGFRQAELYRAMSWPVPEFAHLPLIHSNKGKMSKRHGNSGADKDDIAVNLADYRKQGYIPEAIRNTLLRLGWSYGNQEYIDTQEALDVFRLGDVGRSSARFDQAKLDDYNRYYLRTLTDEGLWRYWQEFFPESLSESSRSLLENSAGLIIPRHATLRAATDDAAFVITPHVFPLTDQKAIAVFQADNAETTVRNLHVLMTFFTNRDCLDPVASLKNHVKQHDLNFGTFARLLRVALTGTMRSPELGDVFRILGRALCVKRIEEAIEACSELMSPNRT